MAETTRGLRTFPDQRECPFSPPPEISRFRAEQPVTRVSFPSGDDGWLVTRHAEVREALNDPRLSAQSTRYLHFPQQPVEQQPAAKGMLMNLDPPDHTAYRRLLSGGFTVKRMRALRPRFQRIVDEHLDQLERTGPPLDLVEHLALPVPTLAICELLGVPYSERAEFQHDAREALRIGIDWPAREVAGQRLGQFMAALIKAKRIDPGDDLLSELIAAGAHEELIDDGVLATFGVLVLVGGHETTANMIGLGTAVLLQHPDQLALLRADPSLAPGAVEELLRYLTIVHFGLQRQATEDLEIDGQPIRAGEYVSLHLPSANLDDRLVPEAERLDITRPPQQHLAFGFGPHQCLGQQLARIELQVVFSSLFTRFPNLELAVPLEQVPFRHDMAIYGVHQLPVRW